MRTHEGDFITLIAASGTDFIVKFDQHRTAKRAIRPPVIPNVSATFGAKPVISHETRDEVKSSKQVWCRSGRLNQQ
jgi:hypothetical protein